MITTIIILAVVTAGLIYVLILAEKTYATLVQELQNYKEQYKDIINIDTALAARHVELKNIKQNIDDLKTDFDKQKKQLKQDFISKRRVYEDLLKETSILEENLENISYGLYKPSYNYDTSEKYKQKSEEIWDRQKNLIKDDKATTSPAGWTVNGSEAEGRKMIKRQSKLMLRAFNGECDSAITKVNWNNIGNMEARIIKAYEAINNLGSTQKTSITKEYADLKLQELRLAFELREKLYQEKEEQRKIREQIREEERAQREIEKAKQDAEQEEARYRKALEEAKAVISNTTGEELDSLNEKIKTLEENLQKAQQQTRTMSQAQLTKAGHVYIISNIGSFGDHVYKVGMTRRLDPRDRIRELSDASVPFEFDVHGLIYSENAPELEKDLHNRLDGHRLNLVDLRSEFFNVKIDEIEKIAKELNLSVELTKIAEAREFRETQALRETKVKQSLSQTQKIATKELDKFPATIY